MLIDTHIHSIYSDGTKKPSEIVAIAKEKNLDIIALTDHNTYDGHKIFLEECKKQGVKGIPGIEISTEYKGKEIHILGYFNPKTDLNKNKKLAKILADFKESKNIQNKQILMNLKKLGFEIDLEEFFKFASKLTAANNINRVHIAKYMIFKGYAKEINEVFNKYIGENSPCYAKRPIISIPEAIKAIKESKGIAIIAHIGEYKFPESEFIEFLNYCIDDGIDGIELLHVHNTINDMKKIISELGDKDLIYTSGSDYHGDNKPNQIGEFCSEKIPEDIISFFNKNLKKTLKKLEDIECI